MASEVHKLSAGAIAVWAEPGGPIMLKAVETSGDPVELNEHEAEELAALLRRLVREIT